MTAREAIEKVLEELHHANAKYGKFSSKHEGYAIIREELEELWEEIKSKNSNPSSLQEEARQVAAMAIQFMRQYGE